MSSNEEKASNYQGPSLCTVQDENIGLIFVALVALLLAH
jgi:hypothetical protein